jgi:hypothetical protein
MAKEKKQKKAKGGAAADPGAISIAAHPRARASIRRTRARVALIAFALVFYLSWSAGVPGQEALLRALAGGIVGNLLAWACALAVWRSLVMAEVKLAHDAFQERQRARAEAIAAQAAAAAAARAEKAAARA